MQLCIFASPFDLCLIATDTKSKNHSIVYCERFEMGNASGWATFCALFKGLAESHALLSEKNWKKISFVLDEQRFTFIPNSHFHQSSVENLLMLNAHYTEDDAVVKKNHIEIELTCIFAMPKFFFEMVNTVFSQKKPDIQVFAGTMVESVLNRKDLSIFTDLHIYFHASRMTVVASSRKLKLANTYNIRNAEDVLYFISLIATETQVNRKDSFITLYGETERFDVAEKLKEYFKKVIVAESEEGFDKLPNGYLTPFKNSFLFAQ